MKYQHQLTDDYNRLVASRNAEGEITIYGFNAYPLAVVTYQIIDERDALRARVAELEKADEERRAALLDTVRNLCSCGGKGEDDPGDKCVCDACLVWWNAVRRAVEGQ